MPTSSGPANTVERWQERYRGTVTDWQTVAAAERTSNLALVPRWESRLAEMRSAQRALLSAGRWRGGPRTLLAALDVQYQELAMTAGLDLGGPIDLSSNPIAALHDTAKIRQAAWRTNTD